MPQSVPDDRPHSDLTRSILESAMRVQSVLGVGLLEKPYKVCLAHALRQCLFGDGPADAAVAVFERMDRLEINMRDACPGESR